MPLPAEKVAIVELLRVLLKACAARNKVAPRLIADGEDLERLAVEDEPDIAALKGWRYEHVRRRGPAAQARRARAEARRGEVVPVAMDGAAARSNDQGCARRS